MKWKTDKQLAGRGDGSCVESSEELETYVKSKNSLT